MSHAVPARIPERSFWKIMAAVHDFDDRHVDLDRHVKFKAQLGPTGWNETEVIINTVTMDGRQVDDEVRIFYRNGLFRSASIFDGETSKTVHRLSDAINHLLQGQS